MKRLTMNLSDEHYIEINEAAKSLGLRTTQFLRMLAFDFIAAKAAERPRGFVAEQIKMKRPSSFAAKYMNTKGPSG